MKTRKSKAYRLKEHCIENRLMTRDSIFNVEGYSVGVKYLVYNEIVPKEKRISKHDRTKIRIKNEVDKGNLDVANIASDYNLSEFKVNSILKEIGVIEKLKTVRLRELTVYIKDNWNECILNGKLNTSKISRLTGVPLVTLKSYKKELIKLVL